MRTSSVKGAQVQAGRRGTRGTRSRPNREIRDSSIPGLQNQRNLNAGAPTGWQRCNIHGMDVAGRQPEADSIELYATISTWMDADIIEANVRNCFENGCSKVFILDNASMDRTVEVALAAGATLWETYTTEYYNEDLRIRKQNEIIEKVTKAEKHKILWWMTLDADEFCAGHNGERVIDTLQKLPEQISTVGSICIDLYPTPGNPYILGRHPAACFTHGIKRVEGCRMYCSLGHYKHIYFKQTDGLFNVAQTRGNHSLATPGKATLLEPDYTLQFFHAPYRRYEETFTRLQALCDKNAAGRHRSMGDDECTGNHGAIKRWRGVQHLYAGEFDKVEMPHSQIYGRQVVGIAVYPWRVLAPSLAGMFPKSD